MKIIFFDCSPKDYTVESVSTKPMGGSETALCYVSRELAGLGHEVSFLNWTTTPGLTCGVACYNLKNFPDRVLTGADYAVFLNYAEVLAGMRPLLDPQTKMIFWTQHAHDQGCVAALHEASVLAICDYIVFVSDWQRSQYIKKFDIDKNKTHVLRNAISLPFENLFENSEDILAGKISPPTLVYTSTPFRGLDVLLDVFPTMREQVPGLRLKVFSSMKVYGVADSEDRYKDLYKRCQETQGVEYWGSVPQPELAGHLKKATVLAYPNTFAETSCIAVMEALAAGLSVVSSDLGALHETGQGFARLISPPANDRKKYGARFVSETVQVLQKSLGPATQKTHNQFLLKQVRHMNQTATWRFRATEWNDFLVQAGKG